MAVVQGIVEELNLPVYDALTVEPGKQLREEESTSILKFFVDVQRKTKLETNLQSASLLPHYNTFEARAMRVIISDEPPVFPDDKDVTITGTKQDVTMPPAGHADTTTSKKRKSIRRADAATDGTDFDVNTNLQRAMELLAEARDSAEGETSVFVDPNTGEESDDSTAIEVVLTTSDIESGIDDLDRDAPPTEQVHPNNGSGNLINKFIFNTVTTLFVGEKIMIQMPTWFFPGGAGAFSEGSKFISHGEPTPLATFRFAKPVFVDRQQNFRVEIEIPDKEVLDDLQKIYGPFKVWVVLDGFMRRDVQ
jgi:hypothetical protein